MADIVLSDWTCVHVVLCPSLPPSSWLHAWERAEGEMGGGSQPLERANSRQNPRTLQVKLSTCNWVWSLYHTLCLLTLLFICVPRLQCEGLVESPDLKRLKEWLGVEQGGVNRRREELLGQLSSLRPPQASKSAMYEWNETVLKLHKQLGELVLVCEVEHSRVLSANWMHTHTYTHMHSHTHTHMHSHTHTHTHTHAHTHTHTHTHTRTHTHIQSTSIAATCSSSNPARRQSVGPRRQRWRNAR